MGLPNILSLARLALAPLFIIIFMLGDRQGFVAALVMAFLIEFTDILDGYLARKKNATSDFGKLIDPMADCITHFSVFMCFLWAGYAHLWMIVIIFYREFIVAYIRVAAALSGTVLAARMSGKLKAITQAVVAIAILVMIVFTPEDDTELVIRAKITAQWLMGLVTLVTLWSGIEYVLTNTVPIRAVLQRQS